ncbi:MAG TPA: hypothetical protein PLA41_02700 [Candidatus Pacearchaeota archaeon]|jgi:hypothetical protein|nr:hypothetical protein [Candidatus Parcubacteria bacterium]HNZ83968.1 hypothetical protein [Candidatus Pacearchaeota archaeon]HOU46033.1 hypothetical protein [Candidatus Pacearchaeota archaeon]HPM08472.1 hypothetical protein [Candidatus Pacearchaeota archaeon]HQI74856.1 hypothetical protein [Candidatus Pacearchaeota archaeon]
MRNQGEYSILEALEALSNIGKLSGKKFCSNRRDILNGIVSNLPEEKRKEFKNECYEKPGVRETVLLSKAIIASALEHNDKCNITDILNRVDSAVLKKIRFNSDDEASSEAKQDLYKCIDDFEIEVTEKDIAQEKNFNKGKTFEITISLIAESLRKKYFRTGNNLAEFI